ncbi:hypothetical protein GCM10022220_15100 [Actinocatenispora rupis]|uniref:Uncharacterized protein n=1 Tax=Actinocatenispora rupis TaxID=519421 RepID=A0A8J3N8X1_9ACTN|nr:hypothetical protein Aru02nite_14400 [Actinocatenispora rupis]
MSSTIHSLGPNPASRLVSDPPDAVLVSPLLWLDTAVIASSDAIAILDHPWARAAATLNTRRSRLRARLDRVQ